MLENGWFGVIAIKKIISFIMPIGNPERDYDNIHSIVSDFEKIGQSELILVIDAFRTPSVDQIIKNFSGKSHVIVLHSFFGNPGAARNFGKNHATGEWISFIDSDDKIDFTNYLKMVLDGIAHGAELSMGNFGIITRDGKRDYPAAGVEYKNVLKIVARNPGIWRMSFKSSLVKEIEFPSLRMAEDQIFLARFRFWDRKIFISNLEVYTYRRNVEGQLTRNRDAISDLLHAQTIVLDQFLQESLKFTGSRVLARIAVSQILSSLRHLGFQGFIPLWKAIRKVNGIIRALRLGNRLGCMLLIEIQYRIYKIIRAKGTL